MASDTKSWQEVELGQVVKIKHGWPFKSKSFCESSFGKPIVVAVGNFRYTGGFRFDSTNVKHYLGEYPAEYELRPGDILLVMTCQTSGGEILGVPARVPFDGKLYLHNQRLGKVVANDRKVVDDGFLYYVFIWPEFNQELYRTSSGSKILHTSPGRIEAFRLSLPPLREQQNIARILGALDDKIELNREMNGTLEAMARALFKSWFVDFDPVTARASGRVPALIAPSTADLFPNTFTDSELGPIPQGWEVGKVDDFVEGLYDGPHATPKKSDEGAIFLGIKNLTGSQIDLSEIRHIAEEDWPRWTRRISPQEGDIVLTYEATIGFFAMIPPDTRCCLGRRLALVRPTKHREYLFHWFVSQPFQDLIEARTIHGSTVSRTSLTDFPTYPVLVPSRELRDAFCRFVKPVWSRIHSNQAESRDLAATRDALLPELLSGRIRLRDAERMVEEVV
tara:strand:+ start:944 stop:2293 length:1350 start_codon:yes stop_codon:yes gene_type:complete